MRICFYAPFKPLGHSHPSGDLIIATGLFDYLSKQGHRLETISDLRTRWFFWKPWLWPRLLVERKRVGRRLSKTRYDLWFTYHAYYKAPDLLGPFFAKHMKIPYVIFQGIYATKRKKRIRTWPGFVLNNKALCASRHIFTNKQVDLVNLRRLLSPNRLSLMAPGIEPAKFTFDPAAKTEFRQRWNIGNEPVILTAAMFRPDVKTEGLRWVIRACGELVRQGNGLRLVIAGDGKERERLQRLANALLPGRTLFLGKLSRNKMYQFYSAGDLFVFPGFRESLGMVFLEAQSCGLPVVAFANGGIPEVVRNQKTGLLVPRNDYNSFVKAIASLLADRDLRKKMGRAAADYVRRNHDLDTNYRPLEKKLLELVDGKQGPGIRDRGAERGNGRVLR